MTPRDHEHCSSKLLEAWSINSELLSGSIRDAFDIVALCG